MHSGEYHLKLVFMVANMFEGQLEKDKPWNVGNQTFLQFFKMYWNYAWNIHLISISFVRSETATNIFM